MQQEKLINTLKSVVGSGYKPKLEQLPEEIISSVKKVRVYQKKNTMKLKIDLSKEEAEAFKAVAQAICPPEIPMDTFTKSMFLFGINSYIEKIQEAAAAEKAKENLDNVEVLTPAANESTNETV